MDKELLGPLSGFRDNQSQVKPWLIGELQKAFEQYGYQALETPMLERQEILLGKLGDEGQKQLYLFQDNGDRPVGLRYDLTVPLSRFVAGNLGSLVLPYKRYEIGSSFRAEKPQKGRYRQFTQADIDIIGAPELASELELFSMAAFVCERLGITLKAQVNDRRLLAAVLDRFKIPTDKRPQLLTLLDKKDKLTEAELTKKLDQLGLTDVERRQVSSFFLASDDEAFERVQELLGESELLQALRSILEWSQRCGLDAAFAPAMVRGLEYYTGPIFEFKAAEYDGGTVIAGGRYDSLIENLTGQKVPAVGLSFGVDRLSDLLEKKELPETLFVVRLPETTDEINPWVRELRQNGRRVEVYLDATVELGKQIKYADKRGYQSILIPFEAEWQKGLIVRKNLQTGTQEAIQRTTI